jgi:CheY-like chemotaxis protein
MNHPPVHTASKCPVLVVEDETIIARDIAMQLIDLGYEPIGPATTGEQAIEMAGLHRPTLVLMDIHLASAMDGIAAAQVIRDQYNLTTLFLSAFTEAGSLARAKLAKPAGYLSKPFTEDEFSMAIEKAFFEVGLENL